MTKQVITLVNDENDISVVNHASSLEDSTSIFHEDKQPEVSMHRTPVLGAVMAGAALGLVLTAVPQVEAQMTCDVPAGSNGYDFIVSDTRSHFQTDVHIVPNSMIVDPSLWNVDSNVTRADYQMDHLGQPCGGGDGFTC